MISVEINKYLTEAMGLCWHEEVASKTMGHYRCAKCDNHLYDEDVRDYSTWDGFGILLGWAKKQPWWYSFIGISEDGLAPDDWEALDIDLVNPTAFAMTVYDELVKCSKK